MRSSRASQLESENTVICLNYESLKVAQLDRPSVLLVKDFIKTVPVVKPEAPSDDKAIGKNLIQRLSISYSALLHDAHGATLFALH